jgi:hypothetical protein
MSDDDHKAKKWVEDHFRSADRITKGTLIMAYEAGKIGTPKAQQLTQQELWALGGAACQAAVSLSSTSSNPQMADKLRSMAETLMTKSGLTPTQLKDLGMRLIKEAAER